MIPMRQRMEIDRTRYVELEHYPNGEWGVCDNRGGKVYVFEDSEKAKEHAVATAAVLAANKAALLFHTSIKVWDVTIEPGD